MASEGEKTGKPSLEQQGLVLWSMDRASLRSVWHKAWQGREGWVRKQLSWHVFWSQTVHVAKWRKTCVWHTFLKLPFCQLKTSQSSSTTQETRPEYLTHQPRADSLCGAETHEDTEDIRTNCKLCRPDPCSFPTLSLCKQLEKEKFLSVTMSKNQKGRYCLN